jgi:hypothetical protein
MSSGERTDGSGHCPRVSCARPGRAQGLTHSGQWGGTGFNFTNIESAQKFRDRARAAGADGIIANHTNLDGSKRKFPLLAARKSGDPNPYVLGTEAVMRYLTVAEECAKSRPG